MTQPFVVSQNKVLSVVPERVIFFGPDSEVQRTLISEVPYVLSEKEKASLVNVTERVASWIKSKKFTREELGDIVGSNTYADEIFQYFTEKDFQLYFGLDLYLNDEGEATVIELNSHPQSFSQDDRALFLGVHQDGFTTQIIRELFSRNFRKIAILGSKKNAFWRAHEGFSEKINQFGGEAKYLDIKALNQALLSGEDFDLVFRLCSNFSLFESDSGKELLEKITEKHIPMCNSQLSTAFGYRKVLNLLRKDCPDIFPKTTFDVDKHAEYPWFKLDAGTNYSFVTNLSLRKAWEKEVIIKAVKGDIDGAITILSSKDLSNKNIQQLVKLIEKVKQGGFVYVLQENIKPKNVKAKVDGVEYEAPMLSRTTGILCCDNSVKISFEAYGATPAQFSQSKGKISGGTGFVIVPVVE